MPLIRHDGDVDARHRLEQFGREITAGARRRRADIELAGLIPGERDQLREGTSGNAGFAISTIGVDAIRPIGVKSLRGS